MSLAKKTEQKATTGTRRCPGCHVRLSTECFPYRSGWCKECYKKYQKEWYKKRAAKNAKGPNYNGYKTCVHCKKKKKKTEFFENPGHIDCFDSRCKECRRLSYVKQSHGVLENEYKSLINKQGNKCAICGNDFKNAKDINVDHDHDTGNVRGLLCFSCNTGMGKFKDDIVLLKKVIGYLESHKT